MIVDKSFRALLVATLLAVAGCSDSPESSVPGGESAAGSGDGKLGSASASCVVPPRIVVGNRIEFWKPFNASAHVRKIDLKTCWILVQTINEPAERVWVNLRTLPLFSSREDWKEKS